MSAALLHRERVVASAGLVLATALALGSLAPMPLPRVWRGTGVALISAGAVPFLV